MSDVFTRVPPAMPQLALAFELVVDVESRLDMGQGPAGDRFIVPITGGALRGHGVFAGLAGTVLPGGADRQTLRPDGVKELDALYEVALEDGGMLTVRNRVLIDAPDDGTRYAMSRIGVTAPAGHWAKLNRRVFLGTLQSARPERQAVVIRGWLADDREQF